MKKLDLENKLQDKQFIIECITKKCEELEGELIEKNEEIAYLHGLIDGQKEHLTRETYCEVTDLNVLECGCPECELDEDDLERPPIDGTLVRKNVSIPVNRDMSESEFKDALEAGDNIIKWCEKNEIELDRGDITDGKD